MLLFGSTTKTSSRNFKNNSPILNKTRYAKFLRHDLGDLQRDVCSMSADLRAPNKCGTCVAVHTPLIDVLGRDVPPLVRQDQVGDGPPMLWEHDPTELVQFPSFPVQQTF